MSGLPWFRMYTDFLEDPKMLALAFEDQRHFIGVLALKSASTLDQDCSPELMDRLVAQRLWIDHSAIREVKRRLIEAGLIDEDWQPIAWEKRQFVSDHDPTAAERARRYREKQKKITPSRVTSRVTSRTSNGSVTPLDTDTESDTEKEEETTQTADAVRAAAASPRLAPEPGLKKQIDCPYSELAALYATHFPHKRQPRTLSARRKALLLKGWKHGLVTRKRDKSEMLYTDTASGVEFWDRFMAHIANNCRFCMQVQNNFDIEWLFSPRAIDNIIDGKYDTVRDGGRSIT